MNYFLRYFLPGIFMIGLAFFAGAQKSLLFALIGFLAFFLIGVTLMVEGWKQRKKTGEPSDSNQRKQ